jgi:hypothetical protein
MPLEDQSALRHDVGWLPAAHQPTAAIAGAMNATRRNEKLKKISFILHLLLLLCGVIREGKNLFEKIHV